MPATAKNQRFVFMGGYLSSVLSMREAALTDRTRKHSMWSSDETLPHLMQTLTVMLEAPLEQGLLSKISDKTKRPRHIVGSIGIILD